MQVIDKLAAVFRDIDGTVTKDGRMTFGDRFQYASDTAYIEALQPALKQHGVMILPDDHAITIDDIGESRNGAKQYRVTDIVRWKVYAEGCEGFLPACSVGQGVDSLDKAAAKAETQAHKYILRQLFCIEVVTEEKAREKQRKIAKLREKVTAAVDHHPTWKAARSAFCGQLKHNGLEYEAVAAWCEANNRLRPSQMDRETRKNLMDFIENKGGAARISEGK